MAMDSQVVFADGKLAEIIGCVYRVSVSFGNLVVPLSLFVLRNAPFETIIGSSAFESMLKNLDYGRQKVTLVVGRKKAFTPLLGEPIMINGVQTDSEDFTSLEESCGEQFPASS